MSEKDYERFRHHARECQEAARKAFSVETRENWLKLAQDWLRMIPEQQRYPAEVFNDANMAQRTGQMESSSSH